MKALSEQQKASLRALPQVEELLRHGLLSEAAQRYGHRTLVRQIRDAIAATREDILASRDTETSTDRLSDSLAQQVIERLAGLQHSSLKQVINATGVILHTNLGRSVLADAAQAALAEAASGYSTLEYDVSTRERGSRHSHAEQLLCALTGAEAAMVVNNNAAAVILVLSALAAGREVLISRGELVEIGGSFRIPDIMEHSGAHMVEVGTTNRTTLKDYERFLSENTALIAKVHPSNYQVKGFTASACMRDLVSLAHGKELPLFVDQGTGLLFDLAKAIGCETTGSMEEPTVPELVQAGCDLVSFSGDKLLGGPQAGLIVGRRELIERLKSHPLARALRLDKLSLAALVATLQLHLEGDAARLQIPTLGMLAVTADELHARAQGLCDQLRDRLASDAATVSVVPVESKVGGGTLPILGLRSWAVALDAVTGGVERLGQWLAAEHQPPVIGRVSEGRLLLDVRTILDDEELAVVAKALIEYVCTSGA
jgi:L-seryl-tRNA(Ser) seleniumtransferase